MAVGFRKALTSAPPGAIESVEARLEITLPDDYKEFLGRHNGGYLEPNFYNRRVTVRYFYSAGPNDDEHVDDLETAARNYWPPNRPGDPIDPSFLPIGENVFGNVICLKVRGEDYGAVYFWDHELAVSVGPYTRVTDSFSEFFEGLRPMEELED
jgi:cell wall assembly regulator SMI1